VEAGSEQMMLQTAMDLNYWCSCVPPEQIFQRANWAMLCTNMSLSEGSVVVKLMSEQTTLRMMSDWHC